MLSYLALILSPVKNVRIKHMMRYTFICLLATFCYAHSFAQDVVFKATVSSKKVGIDDAFEIKYIIENVDNLNQISAVRDILKDFQIVGGPFQGQSTTAVNANGQIKYITNASLAYALKARRTGTLTIPAGVAIGGDGTQYRSNVVTIEVVKGSLRPRQQRQSQQARPSNPYYGNRPQNQQPNNNQEPEKIDLGKDLYLKVEVDKNKVYQGEQITASYKLFSRVPGYQFMISKLPSLNGFWTQDFIMPAQRNNKPTVEVIDGVQYHVLTLKKSALFPQQTGTLELDPTEVEGVARIIQRVQRNPFGNDPQMQRMMQSMFMNDPRMYEDFFSQMVYRDIPVTLKSKSVKIRVLPLPDSTQPESYTGAVGNFDIQSSIDKTDVTTDDVITLKLDITGKGNIKIFNAPVLSLPNGLTAYDPQILDTITERKIHISGTKTVTYTITPQTPGKYEIPSINFTYFNPETGKYTTLNTPSTTVNVTAGKTYKPEKIEDKTITDIHNIVTIPLNATNSQPTKPILYTVGYWSIYAIPFISFIGLLVWKKREEELSKDSALLKNKRANKVALKRLKTAQKLLQDNNRSAFYEEVSKAIWLYLSDKLHIPISNLSKDNIWGALSEYHINQTLQEQLNNLLTECETALYAASSNTEMKAAFTKAVDTISKLEESFKK